MTQAAVPAPIAPRRGILLLAAGIFAFTAMDAVAKHLVGRYPAVEVVWVRNLGQVCFVVLYLRGRLARAVATRFPVWHLIRAATQLGVVTFFFISLKYVGLAEATALADINPLLITLGAGLFLGERLGRARLFGVALAAVGALVVLRPGMGVFDLTALLPLVAAFLLAISALITRRIAPHEPPWAAMFYAAAFGALATSAVLPLDFKPIATVDLASFAVLALLGTVAQFLLIRAYSQAEAAALAPFSYLDMVYASFWSIVVYADWPDAATLVGALVIALAGIYVWRAETPS